MDQPFPVAAMDSFSREFLALCHAHNPAAPCMYLYCGRDYQWRVLRGLYTAASGQHDRVNNQEATPQPA
jgi:hypothetical protein